MEDSLQKKKRGNYQPALFIPKDKKDRKPFVTMSPEDKKKERINAYPYIAL